MNREQARDVGTPWAGDPQASGLFEDFPLALALLGDTRGLRTTNRRFAELLDPACLDSELVASAMRTPGAAWANAQLPAREGGTVAMRVQALRAQNGLLIIFNEAAPASGVDALDSLRLRVAELERTSVTDPLTGAWNRAHFNRVVESELSRSLRLRQSLSLILIGIDHFKKVNDSCGHATGDVVLCELVEQTRKRLRGADLLFRWGGEEFAVLAPATSVRAASVLAESIRELVENNPFPRAGPITISLGVAEHLATESANVWFRRADAALYDAKASGRNLVKVDPASHASLRSGDMRGALRLEWHDAYECGNEMIDEQHRELFDRANKLIDAVCALPAQPARVQGAFTNLLEHIKRHFRDEEALLLQVGYPKQESHARTHAHLLRRAIELKAAADAGKATFGDVVELLAHDIVARHLFTADADFFPMFEPGARVRTVLVTPGSEPAP